jgi:hypothetical protein
MIYFFDTCVDSIRTIPSMQHDKVKPEDLDSDGEDHCADEVRYACMSRPWMRVVQPKDKTDRWDKAFDGEEEDTWCTA